jgi:hypothetical protein
MESFDWIKPSPLWQPDGQDALAQDFFRPLLLQFETDDFMDEFLRIAARREPDELAKAVAVPARANKPLKLFQPIHERYYLACASLCCRLPGFPDRDPHLADGENVFFVMRKIVSEKDAAGNALEREYAWVIDERRKGQWKLLVDGAAAPDAGEERLPLFPTTAGNERSFFFGYVPVTSRATFRPADDSPLVVTENPDDPRPNKFNENITRALTSLLDPKTFPAGPVAPDQSMPLNQSKPEDVKNLKQQISLFLLYDLDTFLQQYLPKVSARLKGQNPALTQEEQDVVDYLQDRTGPGPGGPTNLALALKDVSSKRQDIANLVSSDPLPDTIPRYDLSQFNFAGTTAADLERSVIEALPVYDPKSPPPPPPVGVDPAPKIEAPKLLANGNELYALRCVYERAQCEPPQFFISRRTEEFVLASALDPEGPTRQVRLELPRDVSIAALRGFKKSVGFVMSKEMRNKVARITGFEKALIKDEDIGGEGGFGLGFICTFSFQIIFIIAFFLLLMFAFILNIVFWWMAFFRICLPIPVKK